MEDQIVALYWYLVLIEIDSDTTQKTNVLEREIRHAFCELLGIYRKLFEQYNDRLN